MSTSIPHGGKLLPLLAAEAERAALADKAASLPGITVSERTMADLELLGNGGYSPLQGFLCEADYHRVVKECRLADGTVWPFPICLPVGDDLGAAVGDQVALNSPVDGKAIAILTIKEIYSYDVKVEAENVYKTTDEAHPGVAAIYAQESNYAGGTVTVIRMPEPQFPVEHRTPTETRAYFDEQGWKTVVAFQTRNPIHRAHEYLTKVAMENVDGLMVHPLVGTTKGDDIPADVRMDCYREILKKYYPADRAVLSVFPAAMRYAGPREAIFHALVRKNYGVTHFIVGRDHAGVGSYYGTYDAQNIFDQFTAEEIGIEILRFEHSFWCNKCDGMASGKTCPHAPEDRIFLSGTKVREMLVAGELPPAHFSRPEIAAILVKAYEGK